MMMMICSICSSRTISNQKCYKSLTSHIHTQMCVCLYVCVYIYIYIYISLSSVGPVDSLGNIELEPPHVHDGACIFSTKLFFWDDVGHFILTDFEVRSFHLFTLVCFCANQKNQICLIIYHKKKKWIHAYSNDTEWNANISRILHLYSHTHTHTRTHAHTHTYIYIQS